MQAAARVAAEFTKTWVKVTRARYRVRPTQTRLRVLRKPPILGEIKTPFRLPKYREFLFGY